MITTGPYQFCDTCKTETSHNWAADLILSCSKCERNTKVSPAQIFIRPDKFKHLQKEEYEELLKTIEEQPEEKAPIPEVVDTKPAAGSTSFHKPELPMQGLFIKATPLDWEKVFTEDRTFEQIKL
jgi:hypothetical protein